MCLSYYSSTFTPNETMCPEEPIRLSRWKSLSLIFTLIFSFVLNYLIFYAVRNINCLLNLRWRPLNTFTLYFWHYQTYSFLFIDRICWLIYHFINLTIFFLFLNLRMFLNFFFQLFALRLKIIVLVYTWINRTILIILYGLLVLSILKIQKGDLDL